MKKFYNFNEFKEYIISKGGDWATSRVYFEQWQDIYVAWYLPNYPDMSPDDKSICYNSKKKEFFN